MKTFINYLYILLCVCTFSFSKVELYAQTLVENYDYGGSDSLDIIIASDSSWIRHSGTQGPVYRAAGLSYPGYVSSGIGGSCEFTRGTAGVNDGDVHRTFSSFDTTTSKHVYVSFLVRVDTPRTTADYFFHLMTGGAAFHRGRVFARTNSAGWSFGLSKSTENRVDDATVLNLGQTYLCVLKYSIVTGGNDTVKLYVYDTGVPSSEPGSPIVTIGPVGSGIGGDPPNIGSVAIRQGANTPRGQVDGIRIDSSWSGAPLPIQLSSFSASLIRDSDVEITWHTVSETNNYGFEVQRRRGEIGEWTRLAFVEGHGTTLIPQYYSYIDRSVPFGKYYYRIKQIDLDGKSETFPEMEVSVGVGSDRFVLAQNYPNPFNPSTTIEFVVPQSGLASLRVYNILGQEVARPFDGELEGGKIHSAIFDASNLPSGVYYYQLRSVGKIETRRMMLIK